MFFLLLKTLVGFVNANRFPLFRFHSLILGAKYCAPTFILSDDVHEYDRLRWQKVNFE